MEPNEGAGKDKGAETGALMYSSGSKLEERRGGEMVGGKGNKQRQVRHKKMGLTKYGPVWWAKIPSRTHNLHWCATVRTHHRRDNKSLYQSQEGKCSILRSLKFRLLMFNCLRGLESLGGART